MGIPKIFHTIWVGSNPFPEEYVRYLETWKKHHPDWTFMFWTDYNLPIDKFRNKKLYQETKILSSKADVAMYELLYLYGGVYIDADFECFKNIEPLIEGKDAFGCGENDLVISAGIIGFKKGHDLLLDIMGNFRKHMAKYPNEPPNVTTGPIFLTETIGLDSIPMIPTELLYPYGYYEQHRKGETFPDAYAAHHWGGSWLKPTKNQLKEFEHEINVRESRRIQNNEPTYIPKIFHHVWPGTDPIPDKFFKYIRTWTENHPDWQFMLWTPENFPKFKNQKWYDFEETYAGKSDIARYEILNKYGGVYLDMDMECYKPIDEILNGVEFFVTYEQEGFVAPTVMGCVPGHRLIKKIIRRIPKNMSTYGKSKDITKKTGPQFISKLFDYNDPGLTIYPRYYFYPTLYDEEDGMKKKYPDSYGIHHWNGRKKGGWYYNLINGVE